MKFHQCLSIERELMKALKKYPFSLFGLTADYFDYVMAVMLSLTVRRCTSSMSSPLPTTSLLQ